MSRFFLPALALLFIGLKLGKVIDWNWLWVLAPLWIPVSIGVVVLVFAGLCWLVMGRQARQQQRLANAFKRYARAVGGR
jgi:hypothetical protein